MGPGPVRYSAPVSNWNQTRVPPRNGSNFDDEKSSELEPNRGTPLEMVPYTAWRQQRKQHSMNPAGSDTTDLKG